MQRAPADLCPSRLTRAVTSCLLREPDIHTPRDRCQLGGRVRHPVTGTNIELQSHSCPRCVCGAILLARTTPPPRFSLLGLFSAL